MRGKFITLEGLEGCGKSTQIALLRTRLEAKGISVVATREPGGTPLAERIRALVLDPSAETITPECELLLMFAARATHLENLIRPTLERGTWVLCDRFTDASFAYQGAGRGIPETYIRSLQSLVQGDFRPDLTLLIDVPAAVGLQRAHVRRGAAQGDRFEQEQIEFFERVRARFLALAGEEPQRIQVVDGNGDIPSVARMIERYALELLNSTSS